MKKMNVKLFADGADKDGMLEMYKNPHIDGFTTNPTLMKIAGITDYVSFSKDILTEISDKPVSFEVFADELENMERQALEIASWAENVYVKIPITNTKNESTGSLIKSLSSKGVKLNVTAIFSIEQVKIVASSLNPNYSSFVSVFAGRIADTGYDPVPYMKEALTILRSNSKAELLWASPREVFNVYQADEIGCHIITATNSILKKLNLFDKDLEEYSLETVKMFYNDAKNAGYNI
jgi:transaldolase